jgi:hypothetical protein
MGGVFHLRRTKNELGFPERELPFIKKSRFKMSRWCIAMGNPV